MLPWTKNREPERVSSVFVVQSKDFVQEYVSSICLLCFTSVVHGTVYVTDVTVSVAHIERSLFPQLYVIESKVGHERNE